MKTRVVCGACVILFLVAAFSLLPGRGQETVLAQSQSSPPGSGAPPLSNPLKVALLKWYQANEVPTKFPVGRQPYGVAFDGANIWTANFGDGTVSKVRANDGALLGTFPAINAPYGVTFDGANVWVSSYGQNVVKLRASDGEKLGTSRLARDRAGWRLMAQTYGFPTR